MVSIHFLGYSPNYPSLGTNWTAGDIIRSSGAALTLIFSTDGSSTLRGAEGEYYQDTRGIMIKLDTTYAGPEGRGQRVQNPSPETIQKYSGP